MFGVSGCGRIAAATVGLAASGMAAARPLTVDDVLAREDFGRAVLSDRWAVVEVRGPYEDAWRFDLDARTDVLRTRIEVTDLRRPGQPRPLFPAEPGVGYALGPLSPDGARVVVFRLKNDNWQLGVVEVASSQVRWLDVAPELTATGEAAAWIGPNAIAVIAAPDGLGPFELRLRRYPAILSERRAVTAAGGASATVIGSGAHLSVTPEAPPGRLVRLDLSTGTLRTLATGRFTDLEVSASGRWIAAFRSGEIIRLRPGQPVQGPQGIETRRTRLSLIDASTGVEKGIAPEYDMLGQLLRWSPRADELLVFGRRDGEGWPDGRLFRVTPRGGAHPLDMPGLKPVVTGRPGVVHAGWLDGAPIVYAQAKANGSSPVRKDWVILQDEPHKLTGFLRRSPAAEAVIAEGALWLAHEGKLWRIGARGAHVEGDAERPATPAVQGLRRRLDLSPHTERLAVGISPSADGVLSLRRPGVRPMQVPAEARIVAVGATGVLVTAWRPGAGQTLAWVSGSQHARRLRTINARLADVESPKVVPVRHVAPGGRPLTSWVLLPRQPAAEPPPLVVWPYPGSSFPTFPAYMNVLAGGGLETPAVLAGQGYAVLVPSLPLDKADDGLAVGLARQVLGIVDAAAREPALKGAFDPERLGVWGVSFGGYGTVAMLTQTDRFSAAIVQGTPTNLFSMHGDFGLRRLALPEGGLGSSPSAGWTEDLQGDMRAPPWAAVERYVRNSPVLQADKIETPLLIFHGELDTIPIGQAQELFSSLFRQDKDAVLVTYWGEEHRLTSPGTVRDYYRRAFAWLERYLKRQPISAGGGRRSQGPAPVPANAAPRTRPSQPP